MSWHAGGPRMAYLDSEIAVGCGDETWCRWTGKLSECSVQNGGQMTRYCCPQCGEVLLEEQCVAEDPIAVLRLHVN